MLSGDKCRGATCGDLSHHRSYSQVVLVHFTSTALKSWLENECINEHVYFLAQKKSGILMFLVFQFLLDVCFYLLGAIRVILN